MGANRSYNKAMGGVPESMRTHTDTGYKIDGHKVVILTARNGQAKNILNSNSDSPIYIIGSRRNDGSIEIHSVNIFDGHNISIEINLKYDSSGRIKAYNGKDSGTHCHYWEQHSNGDMHRKPTSNKHEPIPTKYAGLLKDIVKFNGQHKK